MSDTSKQLALPELYDEVMKNLHLLQCWTEWMSDRSRSDLQDIGLAGEHSLFHMHAHMAQIAYESERIIDEMWKRRSEPPAI